MQPFASTAVNEPGRGILICQCYGNMSKFERIHAQYPLKFIPTSGHAARLAVVYMLSYGGGIISGDTFNIDIVVKKDAILLLMTQGNTKVFKDRVDQRLWLTSLGSLVPTIQFFNTREQQTAVKPSVQIIHSQVEPQATLLVLPDPVTCFRDASFQSKQVFHLADSSQLVLLDWFTCGRLTRGEVWSFRHYSSRIDVHVDQKIVIKDAMVLEDEEYMKKKEKETAYAERLHPYLCFATLIIISSGQGALSECVSGLQKKSEAMRLLPLSLNSEKERQVLWSMSPIMKNRGVLVRMAGMTTELVRDFVKHECLVHLQQIVGEVCNSLNFWYKSGSCLRKSTRSLSSCQSFNTFSIFIICHCTSGW
ncbi:Putative Urease accessory protein UreD [Rhizopus microsporus]|nr:Putative Urease accessory protein UreD [Rhizopus microsporus]